MCVRLSPAAAAEASASAEHARLRRDWRLCACWARQGYRTRQHAAWGALRKPLGAAPGARAKTLCRELSVSYQARNSPFVSFKCPQEAPSSGLR